MKRIRKILSIVVLVVLIGTDFLNSISYAFEQHDLDIEISENGNLYVQDSISVEDGVEDESKVLEEENIEEKLEEEPDLSTFEVDEKLDINQNIIGEDDKIGKMGENLDEKPGKKLDDEGIKGKDVEKMEIEKAWEMLNDEVIEKSERYNNVTVSVRAEQGTFPDGTYVKIEPIKGNQLDEVKQRISDEDNNVIKELEVTAFDIKFEYELGDGNKVELQPLSGESVQVRFDYSDNGELKQAENEENKSIVVYHIDDKDENGKIVERGEEKVERIEINNEESEKMENGLVVDAEGFSIYVLALTENGISTPLVITLDSNGGYFIETGNINVSDGVGTIESVDGKVVLPFATKYTHGLLGWYLSGDEENLIPAGSEYEVTENVILYAKWEQCAEGYSINANWQCECIEGTLLPNGKCDIGLINLSVFGYTGYLMEKNLGATAVFNGIFSTGANGMNEDSFGKYYQWGNNYGFDSYTENAGQLSSSYIGQLDVSGYDWDNPYISGTFLKSKDKNTITWMKPVNYKLWGGQSNLADKKQGPCPVGYHVPSSQERVDILTVWSGSSIRTTMFTGKRAESRNFAYDLKLPFPGYRARTDTKITDLYILGRYCSSTPVGNTNNIYLLKINENTTQMLSGAALEKPANGFSVRCLKNTVDGIKTVIFDSNRGTLIDDQRVPVGNKLVKPEDPQLPGYVFLGWYKDAQFSELWDFETDEVMENITLYAKWNYIQNFDDLNLVFLSNEGGPKYTTIMDRNLGATEIFNGQIGLSDVNVGSFGYQYQWGNNYGFEHCNSLGCTDISNSSGYLSSSVFRSVWAAYIPSKYARNTRSTVQNWMGGATINDNIWGGAGDTISENGNGWVSDRQGPCPDDYYVPSVYEWSSLSSGWSDSVNKGKNTGFISDLLLPPAGVRNYTTGEIAEIGDRGVYWSSSPSSNSEKYAYFLNFKKDNADVTIGDMSRSAGRSVRCVKSVLRSETSDMNVHVSGGKAVIVYTGEIGNGKFIKLDNLLLSVNNATFEGWYSTPDFAVGSEITLQSQIPSDLYAKITCNDVGYEWDGTQCKNGVKLIFNSMGGSYVPFQIVESGTTGYRPEDPIKTGSVFMGWFLDGATNEFNFTGTVITGETTLYAHWNEGNYTVTFNSNGGSAVSTQNVDHGNMAIKPEDPIRKNSHFEKWQLNGIDYNFTMPVESDIKLDAVWTCDQNYKPAEDGQSCVGEEVRVTIDGEDDGEEHHYGDVYTLPEVPGKAAERYTVTFVYENGEENTTGEVVKTYEGSGWRIGEEGYEAGREIELLGDVTLISEYKEKVTGVTYPEVPEKDHYRFVGWYNNGIRYDSYSELAPITLTAKWVGEEVRVTIDGEDDGEEHHYGDVYTLPEVPGKAAERYTVTFVYENGEENTTGEVVKTYEGSGWRIGEEGYEAGREIELLGDVTLISEYKEKVTGVTYPEVPEKDHYRFVGWYNNGIRYDSYSELAPITLTAKWVGEEVRVTIDGEDDGEEHHYGDVYTLPEVPGKAAERYTVTFVYENGEENTTGEVVKTYEGSGWRIGEEGYEAGREIELLGDVTLISEYKEKVTGVTYPEVPEKDHYRFVGWYNNGIRYDSYSELAPITLTAKWVGEEVRVTIDGEDDGEEHHYGDVYTLPEVPGKAAERYTVTFVYENGEENTTGEVVKTYEGSGWRIGEEGYEAGREIELLGDVTLISEYKEKVTGVTYPEVPEKDHYRFVGWYNNGIRYDSYSELAPITLTAKWVGEEVRVTIDGEDDGEEHHYGDVYTLPEVPGKAAERYTVTFVYENGEENTTGEVVKTYEGSGWRIGEEGYEAGREIELLGDVTLISEYKEKVTGVTYPEVPEKDHYRFVGWYNNGIRYDSYSELAPITLTAKWVGEEVRVTIDGEDDGEEHHYGDVYTLPEVPGKAAERYTVTFVYENGEENTTGEVVKTYEGSGWRIGEEGYEAGREIELLGDVTLISEYKEKVTGVTYPEVPEKDHYRFVGWYNNGIRYDSYSELAPITLTAKWVGEEVRVTIDGEDDGEEHHYGDVYTLPEVPGKAAERYTVTFVYENGEENTTGEVVKTYEGSGWRIGEEGYEAGREIELLGDVTLISEYKEKVTGVTYPEVPEKDHYRFVGWYNNGIRYDSYSELAPITLTAKWVGEEVRVTIDGEDDGEEHHYGDVYTLPEVPGKAAERYTVTFVYENGEENTTGEVVKTYEGSGWRIGEEGYEAGREIELLGDVTLISEYKEKVTGVTYPEVPEKDHYRFVGWYNNGIRYDSYSELAPITLTAKWVGEEVRVMFDSNGGDVVAQQVVNYGSIVLEPNPVPTRDHSTLVGWFLDDKTFENQWIFSTDTVVADITLYAKWTCVVGYELSEDKQSCVKSGDDAYSGDSGISGGGGKGGNLNFDDGQHGSAEDDEIDELNDLENLYENDGDEELISQDVYLYEWVKQNGITSMDSFEKSDPEGLLTRGYLAKMVVNYMVNVLGRKVPFDVTYNCVHWGDNVTDWESDEIRDYATKACAFGVMGIGMEDNKFLPNNIVTRAEFGTVISRMLWGDEYNIIDEDNRLYYEEHLMILKKNNIMTQIEDPEVRWEIRKWVWLVFRRVSEKFKK